MCIYEPINKVVSMCINGITFAIRRVDEVFRDNGLPCKMHESQSKQYGSIGGGYKFKLFLSLMTKRYHQGMSVFMNLDLRLIMVILNVSNV